MTDNAIFFKLFLILVQFSLPALHAISLHSFLNDFTLSQKRFLKWHKCNRKTDYISYIDLLPG